MQQLLTGLLINTGITLVKIGIDKISPELDKLITKTDVTTITTNNVKDLIIDTINQQTAKLESKHR
jgi:hypothetical protein